MFRIGEEGLNRLLFRRRFHRQQSSFWTHGEFAEQSSLYASNGGSESRAPTLNRLFLVISPKGTEIEIEGNQIIALKKVPQTLIKTRTLRRSGH